MIGSFPKNFLWGAATSSHQTEGGLTNNWSKWEEVRVSQLSKDELKYGVENYESNSKQSCGSFNCYKEDVRILRELGLKAYRFSIEWSRIEPEKGKFDYKGLEYYKKLVKELRKNNIEPVVTLWHWTIPLWLEEEGGVFSKNFFTYFLRMSKQVLEVLNEDVTYWITINEPEVYSLNSYLTGEWPPCEKNVLKFLRFYLFTFPRVHKKTYSLIKEYNPKSMVSFAKNNSYVQPYNNKIWNKIVANIFRWFSNYLQLDLVKGYMDFIGLNFYFTNDIGIRGLKNKNDRVNDLGWWFKPESIEFVINELWDRYKLPILITENGLADKEDKDRVEWIDTTIKAMSNSSKSGVILIGYLHWSLLDNFEWAYGFWPKFGLVSVDPNTKKRTIKESGKHYSNIVERNGII